jgi:Family of unknown function (DUF6152)
MMTNLLLSVVILLAHHGDAGRYEDNLTLLTGTVVELQFINPHSIIVLDVADKDGTPVRWRGELGGPANLIKQFGWNKTTLKPGDKITVIGRRVKSGAPYINLTEMAKIVMADSGKEIFHTPNALPGLNLH